MNLIWMCNEEAMRLIGGEHIWVIPEKVEQLGQKGQFF
jgi:hypothetical protein